jgi:hypothetical protein
LLEHIQRYFDSRDKSREYLDQKIALFIAQAVITIGFVSTSQIYCKGLIIIPLFISLILYVVAILPYKIWDNPSKLSIIKATKDIINKEITNSDDLLMRFIGTGCIEEMEKAFTKNDKMLDLKRGILISGLILNIIGVFYLVYQVLIK